MLIPCRGGGGGGSGVFVGFGVVRSGTERLRVLVEFSLGRGLR